MLACLDCARDEEILILRHQVAVLRQPQNRSSKAVAEYWNPTGTEPDLVIRADMFLPWRGAGSWRIDKRGRKRLLEALPRAALTSSMLALASSRGIRDAGPGWDIIPEREGDRQSERTAHYRNTIRTAGGAPVFTAEARLDG